MELISAGGARRQLLAPNLAGGWVGDFGMDGYTPDAFLVVSHMNGMSRVSLCRFLLLRQADR